MFRVIKLTKLPREIIYGSERLQVVYYDQNGHYHAHFDSETHEKTEVACCHQQTEELMMSFQHPCRLCRYVTILYYLNDVEAGGETAFPVADNETLDMEYLKDSRGDLDYFNLSHNCHAGNLVIKPRKGTAVMWYNHFMDEESSWLGKMDEYSLHGGCDILKGEKWIANNWITAPYRDGAHIPSFWLGFKFVRDGESCDYQKFDSHGDEPCVIGRKAGLTRINGVKVGHVEEIDLGDGIKKRITRAMKPLLFEIPNFLSDEECDHLIRLAESKQFIASVARGGLQSMSEFEVPDIRSGPMQDDYFHYWDVDKNGKLTLEEVMGYAKKYQYLILTKKDTLEMLHSVNVTELDDGYATLDEFKTMNSLGLMDLLTATALSHPLHRSRFSDQTWINQRALEDPVLDQVTERVVELTRLPREIIYGSERIQVVRYGKHGHYHAHFDSETETRTDKKCCHLYEDVVGAFLEGEGCRLCRYVTVLYYT
ncbi:hypothetical protein ACROYT_G011902 [Oculina patagonica]